MARPRQISNEEILSVTKEMLIDHGVNVPTAAIAKRLGVSQAALFKRFGTKERLIHTALRPPEPSFIGMLDDGPDERPLEAQVAEISGAVHAHMERIGPTLVMLRSAGICPETLLAQYEGEPPPVVAHRALSAWLRRAKRRGLLRKDVDSASVAIAWLGMIHGREFFAKVLGRDPVRGSKRYLKQVMALLVGGMSEREET